MTTVVCGRLCLTWEERPDDGGGDLVLEWGRRRRHVGTVWIRRSVVRGAPDTGMVPGWSASWSTWDTIGAGGENAPVAVAA